MSVSLFNKDIAAGWRVQAVEKLHFHISDSSSSDGFRHIEVPEGTLGTPTGEITIYYAGSNELASRTLAQDAKRLKTLLEHPERFAPIRNALNYWQAAQKLKGDDLLACSISFNVNWDSVPKNESGRGKCLSYLPWLKLVSAK